MKDLYKTISRTQVRQLMACPTCDAPKTQLCRELQPDGTMAQREANHLARIQAVFGETPWGPRQRLEFQTPRTPRVPTPVVPSTPRTPTPPLRQRRTTTAPGVPSASKEEVLLVSCPRCGAAVGEQCWGELRTDGTHRRTASHHSPRWYAAMAHLGREVIQLTS